MACQNSHMMLYLHLVNICLHEKIKEDWKDHPGPWSHVSWNHRPPCSVGTLQSLVNCRCANWRAHGLCSALLFMLWGVCFTGDFCSGVLLEITRWWLPGSSDSVQLGRLVPESRWSKNRLYWNILVIQILATNILSQAWISSQCSCSCSFYSFLFCFSKSLLISGRVFCPPAHKREVFLFLVMSK